MTVWLDGAPLRLGAGGLHRYTAELLAALRREFPLDHIFAAMPDEGRWWLRTGIAARYDVFHGTNFEVPPLSPRPSVMTLHDLSPWRGWGGSDRVRRRTRALLGLGAATMVVTPSEAIRREAIEYFRLSPTCVVAIPHAAADWMRPVEVPPGPPYFLAVGDDLPRKNLAVVRDAARTLGVELREIRHRVPDRDLPALYSGAVALLYPSHYEGFGLPVLEAMQCGAMTIVSRDPALVETASDAALTVDTDTGWLPAMRAALENPDLRARYRAASLARARGFSWSATARATHEVYVEAIARHLA